MINQLLSVMEPQGTAFISIKGLAKAKQAPEHCRQGGITGGNEEKEIGCEMILGRVHDGPIVSLSKNLPFRPVRFAKLAS